MAHYNLLYESLSYVLHKFGIRPNIKIGIRCTPTVFRGWCLYEFNEIQLVPWVLTAI